MFNFIKRLFQEKASENKPKKSGIHFEDPSFNRQTYVNLGTFTIDPTKKYRRSEGEDEFANKTSSPNQRYLLEWENGRFQFSDRGKIVKTGQMIAPNDGKVANNGVFILNNWGNYRSLSGTFVAFNAIGKKILSHYVRATLFNNGLSDDGAFAVCQACNNKDQYDSGKLFVFDLASGKLIKKIIPDHGWADSYRFDVQNRIVFLLYKDGNTVEHHY